MGWFQSKLERGRKTDEREEGRNSTMMGGSEDRGGRSKRLGERKEGGTVEAL